MTFCPLQQPFPVFVLQEIAGEVSLVAEAFELVYLCPPNRPEDAQRDYPLQDEQIPGPFL